MVVPTMSAWLAGAQDSAAREIMIDFSIDPATIPQLSYVDVLNGSFDAATVAGKSVLIGPVAIELGDLGAACRATGRCPALWSRRWRPKPSRKGATSIASRGAGRQRWARRCWSWRSARLSAVCPGDAR